MGLPGGLPFRSRERRGHPDELPQRELCALSRRFQPSASARDMDGVRVGECGRYFGRCAYYRALVARLGVKIAGKRRRSSKHKGDGEILTPKPCAAAAALMAAIIEAACAAPAAGSDSITLMVP